MVSMQWDGLPGTAPGGVVGGSGRSLPTCGAPDRIWLGRIGALLPGVEGCQLGQVGAGSGAGRLTAVEGAAGDRGEALFGHGWSGGGGGLGAPGLLGAIRPGLTPMAGWRSGLP